MTAEPLRATVSQRAALFCDEDEVLVVRRTTDGGWELPGGRLGADEDVVPGLRREVEEETGLGVDVDQPVHTISWRNDRGQGRFGVYYYCTAERREVSLSPEHTEAEWLDPDEAIDQLSSAQGTAVERAREVHER